MKFDAVIVAAGSSVRFGDTDKLTAELCGRPLLAWSLAALEAVADLGYLVVVTSEERIEAIRALAEEWAPKACLRVVAGGARRRDSVEAGLRECSSRYVAIHDGARPLVTRELIAHVVEAAQGKPGAIAAAPVTDTIKEAAGGIITGHPERSRLWAAQTPQVVLRQAWLDAAGMGDNDETDDAAMLSRLGLECAVVDAGAENLKITRPLDLEIAASILEREASHVSVRIGLGEDLHRIDDARTLVLGGVIIEEGPGLAGHSDADVLLHAITDAILGAAALGDIGHYFPPSDPRYAHADSADFLRKALELAREQGWEVANIDSVVKAERPKLAPYITHIRERIAEIAGIDVGAVSVKAKTAEGLDAVGRGEAMAATAVVLLES